MIIIKKIAILVADLFDDNELYYPFYRLQEEGFQVDLIGAEKQATYKSKHGAPAVSHFAAKDVSAKDYDALIIPGGFSPDYMRRSKDIVQFAKTMNDLEKPIAAICHGPWLLISCCDLKARRLTGYHSIRIDIENAGASYLDQEVVIDKNIITSRTPQDLPAFMKAFIEKLS